MSSGSEFDPDDYHERTSLIGKLFSPKHYISVTSVKDYLKNQWKSFSFTITMVDRDVFSFSFESSDDLYLVLDHQPWEVHGYLLTLQEWVVKDTPFLNRINYTQFSIWMQIYGVPQGRFRFEYGYFIGKEFGEVLSVDEDERNISGEEGRFLRVLVILDVNVPLPTGTCVFWSCSEASNLYFRFEKLPKFCCYCGRVGHEDRDCRELKGVYLKPGVRYGKGNFGAKLRASVVKESWGDVLAEHKPGWII